MTTAIMLRDALGRTAPDAGIAPAVEPVRAASGASPLGAWVSAVGRSAASCSRGQVAFAIGLGTAAGIPLALACCGLEFVRGGFAVPSLAEVARTGARCSLVTTGAALWIRLALVPLIAATAGLAARRLARRLRRPRPRPRPRR